jgi:hypothetical protein
MDQVLDSEVGNADNLAEMAGLVHFALYLQLAKSWVVK